jgi:hypothetical protein
MPVYMPYVNKEENTTSKGTGDGDNRRERLESVERRADEMFVNSPEFLTVREGSLCLEQVRAHVSPCKKRAYTDVKRWSHELQITVVSQFPSLELPNVVEILNHFS